MKKKYYENIVARPQFVRAVVLSVGAVDLDVPA